MDSSTQRFFVALVPPEPLQVSVNEIKQEFSDRYGSRKAFHSPPHITMQPPFEWESQRIALVQDALAEFGATHLPVPVLLRGFGAFPPKVIYVHVVKTPELMALQPALVAHLQAILHLPPSPHASFTPHMTVAFRDLAPKQFYSAWPNFEHRPFQADFIASSLTLLCHDGQRWEPLAEFSLTGEM